jgi:hypothetical protein
VTRSDGTFSISNVTPGKYIIIARADGGPNAPPRTAITPSSQARGMNVALTPGVQIGGTIMPEAAGAPPSNGLGFRVMPVPSVRLRRRGMRRRPGDIGQNGQFDQRCHAGPVFIRASAPRVDDEGCLHGGPRRRTRRSVKAENVGLNVIQPSAASAKRSRCSWQPVSNVTVIVFPADERLVPNHARSRPRAPTNREPTSSPDPGWRLSRGRRRRCGTGEWFDPAFDQIRGSAAKVRIEEGDQRPDSSTG